MPTKTKSDVDIASEVAKDVMVVWNSSHIPRDEAVQNVQLCLLKNSNTFERTVNSMERNHFYCFPSTV